ncbi:mitochondrial ribonuclease P catalytic subunit-like isoform X2 [Gigantopelta aegis]|uniref:mitochondrial ribonuclease P catalytic subunit-like isoform X2 n=1 Tax=Gigantopelta aegis TaxID=1735272 RepID=UPI001B88BE10|nr:mitochondrial ribonuclease P catalytic subunit-like isoform X2 [Gigantopelta aegis]
MTKLTQDPGPAYFNPIIIAALREKEMDVVFSLLSTLGGKGMAPSNVVFEKFINMCSGLDGEVNINIRSLFKYFREFNWLPDQELAHQIEELFVGSKTENWKCHWTIVDKSGVCQCCKHRLGRIVLTDADFQNLQQQFLTSTLIGENVYLKSNPEEVERFKDFIQEYAPFDVVVDALNVAAFCRSNMLRKVVEFFARYHHKRVLVIGREHMQRSLGRNLQPIMRMASTFFTDNIGKSTMLVSNDYMRDHKCLLSPNLQGVFERWQRSRQISMKKVHHDNFVFQMPLKYDSGPQEDSNGWHVPYEDCSQRAVYEHPNTYLCLRAKKRPQKRSKKETDGRAN